MSLNFIGQTIGECKITKSIGEGGGGMVFLGSHPKFGQKVVLKILPSENLADKQAKSRFEREIQMSVELNHENIVLVYQASADDSNYYILMEYIDGMDVEKTIETNGVYHYNDAIPVILQILNALEFAHAKQIIHRDVKPSNILVNKNGIAKLCDFGLAKDLKVESDLTCAGMVIGTPNFMSPEQWFGAKDLTSQSDIFSLGATFFYMITGHKPFEGSDATAVMSNSLFGTPPSPKQYLKDIPENLCKIFDSFLARDLESRYKNASDANQELKKFFTNSSKGFFSKLFGG